VLRSIGLPELLVLVIVVGFLVVPFWKIFSKAGYPGVLSLAIFLGFSEWPVLKELNALRQRTIPPGPPPLS